MRWGCPARRRNGRIVGISLLILSLITHAPLPQPDFHNIRHHDGQGEVCEHHDHLLRWHPGATLANDVAVLHWHWFLPGPSGSNPLPEGSGAAVHAHVPPWQATTLDDAPRLAAPLHLAWSLTRAAPNPIDPFALVIPGPAQTGFKADVGPRPPLAFSATFAPGISTLARLQRWTC